MTIAGFVLLGLLVQSVPSDLVDQDMRRWQSTAPAGVVVQQMASRVVVTNTTDRVQVCTLRSPGFTSLPRWREPTWWVVMRARASLGKLGDVRGVHLSIENATRVTGSGDLEPGFLDTVCTSQIFSGPLWLNVAVSVGPKSGAVIYGASVMECFGPHAFLLRRRDGTVRMDWRFSGYSWGMPEGRWLLWSAVRGKGLRIGGYEGWNVDLTPDVIIWVDGTHMELGADVGRLVGSGVGSWQAVSAKGLFGRASASVPWRT